MLKRVTDVSERHGVVIFGLKYSKNTLLKSVSVKILLNIGCYFKSFTFSIRQILCRLILVASYILRITLLQSVNS